MFFVLQHPLADLRSFVGAASGRLSRPSWPLGEPFSDFIRGSGPVLPRRLGGVDEWAGEQVFCRANGAFRFPDRLKQIALGTVSTPATAQRAFRRFQSEGIVCQHTTALSLAVKPPGTAVAAADVLALLRNCLQLPIRLRGPQAKGTLTLVSCGGALAKHYLRATTDRKVLAQTQPWWFSCGRPTAILEDVSGVPLGLPPHAQHVLDIAEISLWHAWIELGTVRCSVWFILGKNPDKDALRRLRIHLLRLHAERECLRLVIRYVNEGKLNVGKDQDGSEAVQRYLTESVRAIERTERFGIAQSQMLDAAHDALNLAAVGELTSLKQARRQVAARVDSYVRRAQEKATVITNISNVYGDVMNTTIQMGNVTVGGDFNVVTAKNIRDSFNKAAKADVGDDLKKALQELTVRVAELAAKLPQDQAETVSADLEALTREATSATPRKKWYELSSEGLIEDAKTVGEMAAPVATAVKAVLALLV